MTWLQVIPRYLNRRTDIPAQAQWRAGAGGAQFVIISGVTTLGGAHTDRSAIVLDLMVVSG